MKTFEFWIETDLVMGLDFHARSVAIQYKHLQGLADGYGLSVAVVVPSDRKAGFLPTEGRLATLLRIIDMDGTAPANAFSVLP